MSTTAKVIKFEKVEDIQYTKDYLDGTVDLNLALYTKELHTNIKLPKRGTVESAGYDFFAPEAFTLQPGETIKIPTGIKAQMPVGVVLQLYPRSGQGFKYRVRLENTVGIVDSDYYNNKNNEGHIFIKITNEGSKTLEVPQGEGFAQGIFMPFLITVDDEAAGIREGGIGSTSESK